MAGLKPLGALTRAPKEEPKKEKGEALQLGFAAIVTAGVVGVALIWRATR